MTAATKQELSFFGRIFLVLLPFLVVGLIAAVRIDSQVAANTKTIDTKADAALVTQQYKDLRDLTQQHFKSIEDNLDHINAKLDKTP